MAQCKKCKATIVWIETPAGRPMPCDPGECYSATAVQPDGEVFTATKGGKVWGLVPHWIGCPYADEFRKPKSEPEDTGQKEIDWSDWSGWEEQKDYV